MSKGQAKHREGIYPKYYFVNTLGFVLYRLHDLGKAGAKTAPQKALVARPQDAMV